MFRKREVLKKVIAYMTLGIDVTRLFSDMVMVSSTAAAATTRSYRYRNKSISVIY
jgi:hypothetical protein